MMLIADSGSTKCDWVAVTADGDRLASFETMGLNPYFHSGEVISRAITEGLPLSIPPDEVSHVFFYGAGTSTTELKGIVAGAIRTVFPQADIRAEHDQMGAAYATYDGEPCISCILGTGSNSCFFDGVTTREEVPSLAYILGDEASGSYFGKILLRAYFYKRLPEDLHKAFEQEYSLSKNEFISRVYRQPNANVYLASFAKFLGRYTSHPVVKEWIVNGMREFIDIHVKCFPEWPNVPVHFVGSVADGFSAGLREAADLEGIRLGRIIKKPIDGLVDFHLRYRIPGK